VLAPVCSFLDILDKLPGRKRAIRIGALDFPTKKAAGGKATVQKLQSVLFPAEGHIRPGGASLPRIMALSFSGTARLGRPRLSGSRKRSSINNISAILSFRTVPYPRQDPDCYE